MAASNPALAENALLKAPASEDPDGLADVTEHDLLEVVAETHSGLTMEAFHDLVAEWLATARHPRFDRPPPSRSSRASLPIEPTTCGCPLLAFGNSDGDLAMLQYTAGGDGARFAAIVHHDDGEREWAYDRDSKIGRLDRALEEARANGWTVVSMNSDWNKVFAGEGLP